MQCQMVPDDTVLYKLQHILWNSFPIFLLSYLRYMIYVIFRCVINMFYNTGISKHYRMVWNIAVDICIWCYKHVISYHNISNNCRVYSNPNLITNMWCSFSFSSIFLSYRNAFMNIYIVANYGFGINCYSIWMTNIKAVANLCINRNLNSLFLCKNLK